MIRIKTLLFSVAALVLLSGCAHTTAEAPAQQANVKGKWVAVEIAGINVADQYQPTMDLSEDMRVFGASGCNRYFGPVKLGADSMVFGAIASSQMACETKAMQREQAMFALFAKTKGWKMEGANLLLLDQTGKVVARFAPEL